MTRPGSGTRAARRLVLAVVGGAAATTLITLSAVAGTVDDMSLPHPATQPSATPVEPLVGLDEPGVSLSSGRSADHAVSQATGAPPPPAPAFLPHLLLRHTLVSARSTATPSRTATPTRTATQVPRTAAPTPRPTATQMPPAPSNTPVPATAQPAMLRIGALQCETSNEYVRVDNIGGAPARLAGWQIYSVVGPQTYDYPTYDLPAGASVFVHSGPDAPPSGGNRLRWTTGSIWNNSGDTAQLKDPQGRVVDEEDC